MVKAYLLVKDFLFEISTGFILYIKRKRCVSFCFIYKARTWTGRLHLFPKVLKSIMTIVFNLFSAEILILN